MDALLPQLAAGRRPAVSPLALVLNLAILSSLTLRGEGAGSTTQGRAGSERRAGSRLRYPVVHVLTPPRLRCPGPAGEGEQEPTAKAPNLAACWPLLTH